ncbi:MAG: thermonuclease family protein [Candidatus Falkowbacteria bacterium]|nr:thermonuclease family protein [Candidatus Falkowbacteria bacterium]
MKKYLIIFFTLFFLAIFFWPKEVLAMPLGSLLYRTSSDGQMYGYSGFKLLEVKNGLLTHLYTGHAGIYVGQENGIDYVVEALASGVVKTPAKNFVNRRNGEKLIGVRLPVKASPLERVTAVLLAKTLAESAPAYDFDFHTQKGPGSGEWICSGLVEKIYESANTGNPYDLRTLQYDPAKYGVNITPDGFDDGHVVNNLGDVLSLTKEFSLIASRKKIIIPAPEKFGYDAGLEHNGKRYFFLPFTQFAQPSLASVTPDIVLESNFKDQEIRGKQPSLVLIFKWSLVNNPISSIRLAWQKVSSQFSPQPVVASSSLPTLGSTSLNIMPQIVQEKTDWQSLFPDPGYKIISSSSAISTSTKKVKKTATSTEKYGDNPEIERVIDGDTFVLKDGRKVRYIGIDAPEIASASRKTTECRGPEAKALNEKLLTSGKIILISDPSAKKDTYSRWLFYVYVLRDDGALIFANQALVESGLADPDFCPPNKATCPESSDLVRRQIIEEAGLRSQSARDEFLAVCAAEKAALAAKVKAEKKLASTTPDKVVIIASTTPTSTIVTKKVVTTTPIIKVATSTNKTAKTGGASSAGNSSSSSNSGGASNLPALASPLITKIFSSGDNHFLEIFNPNNQVFDLASSSFRLEKAKTALDPSIILRFSEPSEIEYRSSSRLAPQANFLIVGAKADAYWLSKADAVALDANFTWGKSGYTIYSGNNAISSPDDQDIVEKIGFGPDALYFSGSPSPALSDNEYLSRIKNSNGIFSDTKNNVLDFRLIPLENSSTDLNTSTPTSTPPIDETVSSSTPTSSDPIATSTTLAINTPGLNNVWHFDDCEGNYAKDSLQASSSIVLPGDYLFDFGKNGCALKLVGNASPAEVSFGNPLTLDEASIAFYYLAQPGANLSFFLNYSSVAALEINLNSNGLTYSSNNFSSTSSLAIITDGTWHQIVASFDSQSQLVILYQDGQEISRFTYFSPLTLSSFAFSGNNILLDELAFWRRPLLSAELLGFFQIGKPFYTSDLYNPLMIPQKAYYWHLGEVESHFNWYDQPKRKVLPADFMPRDFSYDFWWRNSSYPEDGRIVTALLNGEGSLVTSVISLWYSRWTFGAQGELLYGNDPFIPMDNNWHLFTLTYNSQEMVARWYIDGEEILSRLAVWLKKPVKEIMVKAENYPFELSDFSLWEGTLSKPAIKQIFDLGRPFSQP